METKQHIRRQIAALRKACSDEEVEEKSLAITGRVLALPEFLHCRKMYIYADYNHEVRTEYLIKEAWKMGKQAAVPKVEGTEMRFILLEDFSKLAPGYFGIPEPVEGETVHWEDGLMIMPGVAFDRENRRVGYGGGFYDRFLEKHPGLFTVALGFEFQILDQVPFEETDIRPRVIVTEEEVLRR